MKRLSVVERVVLGLAIDGGLYLDLSAEALSAAAHRLVEAGLLMLEGSVARATDAGRAALMPAAGATQ